MTSIQPFHLAIPVTDLAAAEGFYGDLLGCERGRQSPEWIDWNFFGHQLVTHLVSRMPTAVDPNIVDSKSVPVPHFGVVLEWKDWQALAERLRIAETRFVIEPCVRFEGQVGEQTTMFLLDPAGNALEFKAFRDLKQLFAY